MQKRRESLQIVVRQHHQQNTDAFGNVNVSNTFGHVDFFSRRLIIELECGQPCDIRFQTEQTTRGRIFR
jgi:hypothetical protein